MKRFVKVDVEWFTHPKVVGCSGDERALWLGALCYAGMHLTDGVINSDVLQILLPKISDLSQTISDLAQTLVRRGLWELVEGGYRIVGYLKHQTARSSVKDGAKSRAEINRQNYERRAQKAAFEASERMSDSDHFQTSDSGLKSEFQTSESPLRTKNENVEQRTEALFGALTLPPLPSVSEEGWKFHTLPPPANEEAAPDSGPIERPKAKRACQLPDDFHVTTEIFEWCLANNTPEPTNELDKFRDYHRAKGSVMKDWPSAFRTWMRNAARFATQRAPGSTFGRRQPVLQPNEVPVVDDVPWVSPLPPDAYDCIFEPNRKEAM